MLADTPHPAGLGSALTHPHITTDFSESQLELITGVHTGVDACLAELTEIHQVVYRHVGDELLWCTSMPCGLPADDDIPIGRYGRSNLGRAKTVYRERPGASLRQAHADHFRRALQLLHAGGGLADTAAGRRSAAARQRAYQTDAYFSLIRNFRRHSWLLLYLFGASPTVCGSFVAGRKHGLQELKAGTLYLPGGHFPAHGAAGLSERRAGVAGGELQQPEKLRRSLNRALTKPYPPYEAIGLRDGDDYRQLGTTLLQIENEFYGTIRPKPRFRSGERPLYALGERGVEYVEVRCMDNDPVLPGRHRRRHDALSRRVPAALPARRQPTGHAARKSRPSSATSIGSPSGAASPASA